MLDAILTLAIKENKRIRDLNYSAFHSLPHSQYLKQFCTIHIDIGRGVGKTTYITENATTNDLVIVHSRNAGCDIFKKRTYLGGILWGIDGMNEVTLCNVNFVYVDEPSLLMIDLDDVYHLFAVHNPTFILLGK